ncbi:MAG: hypothetical protein ACPGSD_07305 [Flavobacteriales bacterium]
MKALNSFILTIFLVGLCNMTYAQKITEKEIHNAIELANIEYKTYLSNTLTLSEGETELFWGIINTYLNEKENIWNEEIKLYAKDYSKLDDEGSIVFLKKNLKIDYKKKKLKNKYFRKVKKVLKPKSYLRFIQIDYYIETARAYFISLQLPWIKQGK